MFHKHLHTAGVRRGKGNDGGRRKIPGQVEGRSGGKGQARARDWGCEERGGGDRTEFRACGY